MSSGGSMGVRYWIEPLRFAAAQAREMLVAAAAVRLGVPTTELVAADGTVSHAASGRHLAYGELVAELDADDRVIGLHVRAPGPAISRSFTGLSPNTDLDTHVDMQALQNLAEARYRVGALKLDYAMRHNHVPAGPWRAVGATQCTFFLESFVDERARAPRTRIRWPCAASCSRTTRARCAWSRPRRSRPAGGRGPRHAACAAPSCSPAAARCASSTRVSSTGCA